MIDSYFTDPDKIKREAGVCTSPQKPAKTKGEIECQVCMDDVDASEMYCLECGHQTTCKSCWIDYFKNAVKTKECVYLPCPAFKCDVVIKNTVWEFFLKKDHTTAYERYQRFCRENFIEVLFFLFFFFIFFFYFFFFFFFFFSAVKNLLTVLVRIVK